MLCCVCLCVFRWWSQCGRGRQRKPRCRNSATWASCSNENRLIPSDMTWTPSRLRVQHTFVFTGAFFILTFSPLLSCCSTRISLNPLIYFSVIFSDSISFLVCNSLHYHTSSSLSVTKWYDTHQKSMTEKRQKQLQEPQRAPATQSSLVFLQYNIVQWGVALASCVHTATYFSWVCCDLVPFIFETTNTSPPTPRMELV